MSVKFNTSRSRFDEQRRFTGVYQRMGQVAVDADWNEEVRLRTVDARRRTSDLAEGSPDDGFRICADFVLDPIRSTEGWSGTDLPAEDERKPVPELRLDRHDPESLPWVIRSRWHPALRRSLPAPLDLTAIERAASTPFSAAALVFELRFERPPADDEVVDIQVVLEDAHGTRVSVAASGRGLVPSGWCDVVVTRTDLAGLDLTCLASWGVAGLPPAARTWVGALRAVDAGLGNDVVIRGGDGTVAGAGRLLVDGERVFLERDLRYSSQPDFPQAEALPDLPADGSQHHFFYLDVWEDTVTGLDDPFLLEPALDGVDTAARLRTIAQVRALPLVAAVSDETLPSRTGGGMLSTNIASGSLPDRDPPEPFDPCRDRCLFTENASTGDGYIGSDNLHLRIQVLRVGGLAVALWSRDNGSTVMALTQAVAADSTTVRVAPSDAARLRVGDMVVIEDQTTRLRWDAPAEPVLRRLRGVHADTGLLEFDEAGATVTTNPVPLVVGGPAGRAFSPDAGAAVRRWDGADLVVTGVRYRLSDGITFAFAVDPAGPDWRSGDYWTFTARVHASDGAATGVVDTLRMAPPQGPVHHYAPLARATKQPRVLTDLRERYLPLSQVRDRLRELGDAKVGPGVFTVVVGDGVRTFGDVDQSLADGLTGDEALHAALGLLGAQGGSIFIRSGHFQLEHPVLVRSLSSIRILGDGESTVLEVRGPGGAFYLDRVGASGAVAIENLKLIEDPAGSVDIGAPSTDIDLPSSRVRTLFDRLIDARFSPVAMPVERPLALDDIRLDGGVPDFLAGVGARLRVLGPGEGRAAGSVVATLIELRRLQRLHPGTTLAELPEAQSLLGALSALPHGVVTIADSHQVAVRHCYLESRRTGVGAIGVMVTGTSSGLEIAGNQVVAAVGLAALPYAPYLANSCLVAFPRAGLCLDGLRVADNDLTASGAAVTGVHVADGVLTGTVIEGNLVADFAVGILVQDLSEAGRDAATDRIAVRDNRVTGATVVGIEITGDGVDLVGNEIRGAASASPFQAGVQVTGHSSRVTDCWIEIPEAPALAPLALLVGIVVGDGLDDGTTPSRPVFDVEIDNNRIEGSGANTAAIGIVVGGSQPIYDVRMRDNVLRNLGDAAVRTWTTGALVGHLVIESNRIERVALGDLAARSESNAAILDRLQAGFAQTLPAGAATSPRTLLAAVVDSALPTVRAPLDAALRWVERLSLRGAIVLGGVEAGVVRGNRVSEIGRESAFSVPNLDGAEIRTAAIAAVAAAEVVVEDNVIEAVRAPYLGIAGAADGSNPAALEMLDVLAALGFGPTTKSVDRADVHLAAADLRARALTYLGAASDQRVRTSGSLLAPVDALVGELAALGGGAGSMADPLQREANALRQAKATAEQSATATALRATLSQVASATAPDDIAQDAWDAAAQLDLALAADPATVDAVAQRLLRRVDSLTKGLPGDLATSVTNQLRALIGSKNILKQGGTVAGLLGRVATFRDQEARRKDLSTTTDLVGPRKTVVATFAQAAMRQVGLLGTGGMKNTDRIEELRNAKNTLVDQLREVHGQLAADLAADFQDVDRTAGSSKQANLRLRATLGAINQLASGTAQTTNAVDAERGEAQARAATIQVYAKSLDRQIAGLAAESEESAQKSLASFHGLMSQLGELVSDEPRLTDLAKQATAAVRQAATDASQRQAQLGMARSLLDRVRGQLVDVLPPPLLPPAEPSESIERRVAALSALSLELADVDAATLPSAMAAFTAHLDRLLDLVHADAGERQRAHDTETDAKNGLGGTPGPVRGRAVHALASLIDGAGAKALAGEREPSAPLLAAATLASAAALVVDPSEDASARATRVKAFLADRTTRVSAALVAQSQQTSDVTALATLLHQALARLARGIDRVVIDGREPAFALQPSPADGVFAAGIEGTARVAGNLVTETLSGLVVVGAAGHVMTEPPAAGMAIEIVGNRLAGCTALGIAARPDGSSKVTVCDNHVFGCAGVAVATPDPWGQGVVVVSGQGDLLVRGNVLTDNGNTTLRALLHELALDWRGSLGIRGNTVRHLGGGAGGAGLLVLTETVAATLIGQLAQAPFLGTEPPPKPLVASSLSLRTDGDWSLRALAPVSPLVQSDNRIDLGGLRQTIASKPVLQRSLTLPSEASTAPSVASSLADRYVNRSRAFVEHPMIDFLRRPPLVMVPPIALRTSSRVQVEGNDIDAAGPALLLLSDGNVLIGAHVAGNELRSRGRGGAVYLRRTDSTLFAGNRCECLGVVNVVVLRPGKAPVSVSANVVVGAEPVHQILTPPAVKTPSGGVTLAVGLGGNTLQVPVDARKLAGALDRRKNLASNTFSELLADIGTVAASGPAPAGGQAKTLETSATETAPVGEASRLQLTRGIQLSSALLSKSALDAISAELPAEVPASVGARTLYGRTAGEEDDPTMALKKLVDQVTLHESDPTNAKSQVGALLGAAAGDPRQALKLLDQNVLGLDTSKATVEESLDNVSLIHEVLGDVLASPSGDGTALAPPTRPTVAPNPADHSLVVIGGTHVAAVGNATTAGVFVQDADAHVELNP